MRNRLYVLSAAAALAVAAGCNRVASDDFGAERVEERYTTAVADYSAGRLKEAMEGFTAVVQANPANSSARFHLAVLMQDFKRDFLGAICNYREYLMLAPASDKARVARERMESCQKDLAAEFAAKYNLSDNTALKKELNMVRDRLAAKEKDADDAAKKLAEAEGSLRTLERENAKLKAVLKRMGEDEDEATAPAPAPVAAQPVAPQEDAAERPRVVKPIDPGKGEAAGAPRPVNVAAAATPEDDAAKPRVVKVEQPPDDGQRPLTVNPDAKALFEEEEREAAAQAKRGPQSLPEQKPEDIAPVKLTEIGRKFGDPAPGGTTPRAPGRPTVHVVQEGETLGMIALKYYGRKSAWTRIQDANKAKVSSDGNVKAGVALDIP